MVEVKLDLGPVHDADHLHKFRKYNPVSGEHEVVTIVCLKHDCYADGGLDKGKFPPGVIGRKMYWLKKDAQ